MSWSVDPTHSSVEFGVRHMVVSTVKGRFNDFAVDADIDEENLPASRAIVTIAAESIETRDTNRDAHLRSADFFDAEHYPEIRYEMKRIEPKGNDYRIVGDLTIKEVTREVPFEAEISGPLKDPWGNRRIALSAEAKIDRKAFGLNWNAALEAGGVLVSDSVKLHLDLELVKAA